MVTGGGFGTFARRSSGSVVVVVFAIQRPPAPMQTPSPTRTRALPQADWSICTQADADSGSCESTSAQVPSRQRQTRTVRSWLTLASSAPCTQSWRTCAECPSSACSSSPLRKSCTRMFSVASSLELRTKPPQSEMTTERARPPWSCRMRRTSAPLCASKTLMAPRKSVSRSLPTATQCAPSGCSATSSTPAWNAGITRRAAPSARSQSRIQPSLMPVLATTPAAAVLGVVLVLWPRRPVRPPRDETGAGAGAENEEAGAGAEPTACWPKAPA
mmetsp:Transcript_15921/g.48591  ORF Transcript_15921/g.48591 Transcript_15921/m.48591 type:complete len:273 (-) Transcript_15921:167-985(-)